MKSLEKKVTEYKNMREELNNLALQIKETRKEHKGRQRNGLSGFEDKIDQYVWSFRHRHIALSLFRGKKIEEIENPKEGNEPSISLYQDFLAILENSKESDNV